MKKPFLALIPEGDADRLYHISVMWTPSQERIYTAFGHAAATERFKWIMERCPGTPIEVQLMPLNYRGPVCS